MKSLIARELERLGAKASVPFEVVYSDGTRYRNRDEPSRFTVRFRNRGAELGLAAYNHIGLLEGYFDGDIEVDGDIRAALAACMYSGFTKPNPLVKARNNWHELTRSNASWQKAKENAREHYGLGAEFYGLWLDNPLMMYTCAYWKEGTRTLEEAQSNKIEHVCRKVMLKPGESVIDIGSGFGGFMFQAAERYGVEVTGINNTTEQVQWLDAEIRRRGFADRLKVVETDFRDTFAQFDKVVSIGTLEHAGRDQLKDVVAAHAKYLKPGGLGMLHFIGHVSAFDTEFFIRNHVFPGGWIPSLAETIVAMEEAGLEVVDIENLRRHYALTLDAWAERFNRNWGEIHALDPKKFDDRFRRIWNTYLLGCAEMFRSPVGRTHLFQIVFAKPNITRENYPMSRAHLYRGDGAGDRPTVSTYAERRDRLVGELNGARGGALGLAKDTSNLFRSRAARDKRLLDVRAFNHVLAVDAQQGWIDAEGMTTYEALVARALEHGVMPAVVPELKTITLGGAAAGVGIEASSFRYGLVHETLIELEVMTGNGELVLCRPDNEHSDLFHGFPNSYGTLGYALRLRAAAVPVKPFVALEHRRYTDAAAFFEAVAEACAGDADFVDGVAFAPGEYYLNVCRFADEAPGVSDYTFEHIYYRSIREKKSDWLTVSDFIWRWDTDWFWCSKNVGAQIPWVRRLYGRERLGSRTYQRIMRLNSRWGLTRPLDALRGGHRESVIQDVDIPIASAARFLDFFEREIGIAPVWICPARASAAAARFALYPMAPGALYVNFGFWDVLRRAGSYPAGHFNRLIEREVVALGGIKSLYSDSYFPEDEFGRLYGGETYRALKAKYDPRGALPDLYAKCVLRA